MKGTMLIFQADAQRPSAVTLAGPPGIQQLQKAVGGYIEVVPYFDTIEHDGAVHRCAAFCNEEGKLNGLEFNARATTLWDAALRRAGGPGLGCRPVDVLVGPVVVIFGDRQLMEAL